MAAKPNSPLTPTLEIPVIETPPPRKPEPPRLPDPPPRPPEPPRDERPPPAPAPPAQAPVVRPAPPRLEFRLPREEPALRPARSRTKHPSPQTTAFSTDRRSVLRSATEAFVCLLLLVVLFRTFATEGYLISTGSMAPTLLGFHKRVTCPSCGWKFAYGTAYDAEGARVGATTAKEHARCPNCGQGNLDVSDLPRNHGDQILVYKQAYVYTSPRRWEIAVFRNPNKPTEAYVKRVVGLPGEKIQIRAGDVWIDGHIARKPLDVQRQMWIPVFDQAFRPTDDADFGEHWQPDPLQTSGEAAGQTADEKPAGWTPEGAGFRLDQPAPRGDQPSPPAWVTYRDWLPVGGTHTTTIPLAALPADLSPNLVSSAQIRFDPAKHELSSYGVMPDDLRRLLLANTGDGVFRKAVRELAERSHLAPVSDRYGYNPSEIATQPEPIRDLAVAFDLRLDSTAGHFLLEMSDGRHRFVSDFDVAAGTVRLYADQAGSPVRTGPLPAGTDRPLSVEMSLIDQQVILAVNGQPAFPTWEYDPHPEQSASRQPIRFGGSGLVAAVDRLRVFRDVYYTPRSRHAVNRPFRLEEDEFFVLGDNSPVSHDSRRWTNPVVDRGLLLGKPFLVHLPSRPGHLSVAGKEWQIRLPDFDRLKFLP